MAAGVGAAQASVVGLGDSLVDWNDTLEIGKHAAADGQRRNRRRRSRSDD